MDLSFRGKALFKPGDGFYYFGVDKVTLFLILAWTDSLYFGIDKISILALTKILYFVVASTKRFYFSICMESVSCMWQLILQLVLSVPHTITVTNSFSMFIGKSDRMLTECILPHVALQLKTIFSVP